jgi:ABC-type uncharacterized transport system ATPase subunit
MTETHTSESAVLQTEGALRAGPDDHGPPDLEVRGITKRFGQLVALDDVSIRFRPGTFHALLGENGAGKSTLVKCLMGFYRADEGRVVIDGAQHQFANPRLAHAAGLGMVYQHFTLVPSMTVVENLVLVEDDLPAIIDWKTRFAQLERFMEAMPFQLELDRPVSSMAAGEKQKLEILKQLHLGARFLVLDEPTSVLTPDEADQILGLMRALTDKNELSVVLITHKLREVEAFAEEVSVLRQGKLVGHGRIGELTHADMVELMIGRQTISTPAARAAETAGKPTLEISDLTVENDKGLTSIKNVSLTVGAGEIVGIAGVSGNGQTELVEALAGQRPQEDGEIRVLGQVYYKSRSEMRDFGFHLIPESPLNNGCVRGMSVADNLAMRNFDQPPNTRWGWLVNRRAIRKNSLDLIAGYGIKTQGPEAAIETLSGGNVQRTVLARELAEGVRVLVVQNPCFGLDLNAVAEIRNRIMAARNAGAAVLLVSEDLDEILELSDRILVMFEGRIVFETKRETADVHEIGRYMASHN